MTELGRGLAVLGLLLLLVGGALLLAGKFGIPLSRLPRDLHWRGRHTEVFVPLGACFLLSLLLTIGIALARRLGR